jgi:hypothetical protein
MIEEAMATPADTSWTKCFTRIENNNRAIFEAFIGAAREENLGFLHRRMEQRMQFSARMHHDMAELVNVQQNFARDAINDWLEQIHKLNKLYWKTLENRMDATTDAVASILPFPSGPETSGNKRKTA